MCIRMKSPDGGFAHAYSKSEEDALIALGWAKEEEKTQESAPKAAAETIYDDAPKAAPVKAKPGRKPKAA